MVSVLGASSPSAADADRYGTFLGERQPLAASSPSLNGHEASSSRGSRLLRAAGIAGVLLLAAGAYTSRSSSATTADKIVESTEAWASSVAVETATAAVSDGERTFLDGIDAARIRENLHAYASKPHSAGSPQDYETVLFTKRQFEAAGITAEIVQYDTLLSTPVRQRLAILEPPIAARELNLTEASVPGDACTSDTSALPPFLGYSATGNVTASVVYVNYGKPEDFDWLLANNVSLEGKIALVRYGGNFRGLKVMGAEQHGMTGTLIYSDPADDGFVRGPVYPEGPWRPEDSFQRGSSQYLSLAGGDPLTPGFASVPGAPYLAYEDTKTIPHIPALPLSYGQAQHILASLGGVRAPESWQGGLAFPGGYLVGSDERTVVNLDTEINNYVGPIWDVIGTIPGAEEPDKQVLLGNHRDAWVCGAIDPNSGSSVLLEIARGLGERLQTGWRPRRTIVLASWDGEEYGLLGSTEYAEDHAEVLRQQAVAYLNVDGFMGSLVSASASPSIAAFLFETAKAVPANQFKGDETERSLYEQWVKQAAARRASGGANDGTLAPDHLISPMGSGSDFTPYYQHLGIVSANLGFSLHAGANGVYHSSMDSIPFSERFADPRYATHVTAARWWGLLGLRLADADVLPLDYSTYGLVMSEDLAGFEAQVALSDAASVDFSDLHAAIAFFSETAADFHARLATVDGKDAQAAAAWNDKLVLLERHLLLDEGLPHRPWYKHAIFGPGFYEGYAGTAFPGISDAIAFQDDAQTVQQHVDALTDVVRRAADFLH